VAQGPEEGCQVSKYRNYRWVILVDFCEPFARSTLGLPDMVDLESKEIFFINEVLSESDTVYLLRKLNSHDFSDFFLLIPKSSWRQFTMQKANDAATFIHDPAIPMVFGDFLLHLASSEIKS